SSEAVYIIFTAFYTYEMCAEMSFYDRWDNILTITGIFSHIVFISSLVFLRYTEKELLMPIEELARASEDFALQCRSNEQITAAPLPICGSGEVALLERTFNFMMKEIVGFMHDLKVSTAEKEYLKAELNIAARIQSGSVPESRAVFSEGSKAEFYAYMKTAKEVGGDTCDFFMTDSSHAALLIADASGKGISAAMFISAGRQMIKSAVIGGRSPSSVLAEVNRQLYEENSADMFITAWLGILDISTGRLVYANAAHNPPVLIQDGKCRYLESPPHIFLAGVKNTAYTEECIYLKEADSLILYTDGIVEALNENEELYGDERLIGALYNADTESPRSICDDILESTAEFCGKAEQADDMTMLIVKRDFSDSITVDANTENIRAIIGFAEDSLNKMKCPPSKITCFCIALDEIAANICLYAYPEGSSGAVKEPLIKGEAIVSDARKSVTESVVKRFEQRFINIKCGHSSTDKKYTMVISDNGIPFNPLSAPKADTTAALCERAAGGLGIHIVRNLMDEVSYKYEKGRNILTVSLND
ncbi:MAG: SpoIIE family protein phosphatase, partial [Oscillospiraceae bacterium]|nr:SpoIIE family protein phosphatase [Oscillospiraceae bacterium]